MCDLVEHARQCVTDGIDPGCQPIANNGWSLDHGARISCQVLDQDDDDGDDDGNEDKKCCDDRENGKV